MSRTHPCAVTTARFEAGRGPAKGAVLPLRVDLIPDIQGSPIVGLSLVDNDGYLHPDYEDVTVLLDRYEAEALRDALSDWLARR
jgi:maltooligosyltrehalose synthase